MKLLVLVLVLSLVVIVHASSHFCPISSAYNNQQLFHGYPLSLFFPDSRPHIDTVFNCTLNSQTKANHHLEIQLCNRDHTLCPVTENNIRTALSVTAWPQYVDALERLGKDSHINVFYLGGSMTRGAETICKCVCTIHEDVRCPSLVGSRESLCSWTNHITNWLNRTYSATKFRFHDYYCTSRSADYFIDRVRISSANLSHPALIFLDYSVNDAQAQVFSGLEAFIRTIYENVGVRYGIQPTIVVLEQYPHALSGGSIASRIRQMSTSKDYALAYRRIAKHYNTVLISLREVFWTYFGEAQSRDLAHPKKSQRYYPISPFESAVHVYVHPPWYVHLYMADVLAASILHIIKQGSTSSMHTLHALPYSITTNTAQRTDNTSVTMQTTTLTLPPPLYDLTTDMRHICSLAHAYSIDAIAHAAVVPDSALLRTAGWVEYTDHHEPGWVINSLSNTTLRTLSFPILGDVAQLRGHLLKISYLRSYEGMGTATVYMCGSPLSTTNMMEGLWADKKNRVSIPDLYTAIIQSIDVQRCMHVPAEQRTVGIVYHPGTDQTEVRMRHNSQFKVFTVQICEPVYAH